MTTNYPSSKQTFKDYVTGNKLITSEDLNQVRDTVEALEDKLGITNDPDTNTVENKLNQIGGRNVANGYAGLDGSGKISSSQLPASAMEYKGNWDASTGSFPASPSIGDVYIVSVQGIISFVTYTVGSQIVYNGTSWDYYPSAAIQPDASYSVKGIVKGNTDASTSGLTIASGVMSVNSGTGASQIVKLGSDSKLPAVDGSNLTNVLVPKNLTATRAFNTTSGTQIIAHGLGKIPTMVRITANVICIAGGYAYTPASSTGVYSNSNTNCVYSSNTGTTAGSTFLTPNVGVATKIVYLYDKYDNVGTYQEQSATILVDATNITLTWTLVSNQGNSNSMNMLIEVI